MRPPASYSWKPKESLPQAPQSSTPTKADDKFNFKALSLLPKLPALQRDYVPHMYGGASAQS
jgi:hypothetical protein